jgi:adenosylmethionine-8-amino-7-oxononanoate aminotransferase/biotin synthase
MGETREQRVELGIKLLEVAPNSIPINILSPIKGTPLENTPLISDEEILTTIAVFRFIHPKAELRFAGGRKRLSHDVQLKALNIGINSAVVGDMLTTVGSTIDYDRDLAKEAGYAE